MLEDVAIYKSTLSEQLSAEFHFPRGEAKHCNYCIVSARRGGTRTGHTKPCPDIRELYTHLLCRE